jgi:hypothetical protein
VITVRNIFFGIVAVVLFSGCISATQERVEKMLQTNSANSMKKDYTQITKELIVFKDKLDKRNPSAFDKTVSNQMYTEINNLTNTLNLPYENIQLHTYKEYLQIAFSKFEIKNRNDYLILGLYKEIYDAYDIQSGHQITALTYDKNKLQNLYQNLQILKWKLSHAKDAKDEYLFLTWQNNWQIELEKRLKQKEIKTYEDILNLKYIKEGKETLFSQSNMSFEVLLSSMMYHVKNSLETLGVEPVDVGLEAVKTMFIFL